MREMKDSGVPWIGMIPEKWSVSRVKNAFIRKNEKAHQDNPVVLSLARSGVRVRDLTNNEGQIAESYYDYNPVDDGDLLLNPMDLYSGANCSISRVVGVISPAYVNLRYKEGVANPSYYDYYFKTQYWAMAMFAHGKGVSFDNRWTLGIDTLFNYYIPAPSLPEQQRIADFLDDKCAEIDAILEKTRASIEDYKKLKQAVITEAVTKGIRGDRPMKASGVEWIGEIPAEWRFIKFGRVAKVASNLVDPADYPDYPQIAPDSIEKGSGKLLGDIKTVKDSNVISWNHLFHKGQIIYSKIRPLLNKLVIAPFDGLCSADMYPIETEENTPFFVYLMLSSYFLEQIKQVTEDRVKMPKVNQEELSSFRIVLPAQEEQQEIAAYLDEKCAAVDSLIASKEVLITELETYKKSIIYEYVTGKKEVK